ncbi:MAG: LutC/YkgG family protein [Solirubrobacteraceae bacterium]
MGSAREEVLRRVRAALRDVPPGEAPAPEPYVAPAPDRGDPVALFAERVADYRATVRDDLTAALAEHGARRVGIPPGLPQAWRPHGLVELVEDAGLEPRALDALDGALTGGAVAIAETGTFVLDAGDEHSGRRALTLIPDLHVCVVRRDQVFATVPEAIAALDGRRGPFTFVSGPSATSDIELDRVEGVHGPRTLVVVLVA